MSAEIRPFSSSGMNAKKLDLIAKLENHCDVVNDAILLNGCEVVISTGDDKNIIMWLERSKSKYWPSKIVRISGAGTAMCYSPSLRMLFVGTDNGVIGQYQASDDFNDLKFVGCITAHKDRVTGLYYNAANKWLLSISKDRYLCWSDTSNRHILGSYFCEAACTALQYDVDSNHIFIGDSSGTIRMLKCENNCYKLVTNMKGHSDAIICLEWDPSSKVLFSGGNDRVIFCWDIGGKKGTVYELQGHTSKITALNYLRVNKLLLSASEDGKIMIWRMDVRRKDTPPWQESDNCQRCKRPFFWNIKGMADQKTIGLRQHHCRCCGKAVCGGCSSNQSPITSMGFELRVRVCDGCFNSLTDEDITPLATCFDSKHSILSMCSRESDRHLITCGSDRMIKLWSIDEFLKKEPKP